MKNVHAPPIQVVKVSADPEPKPLLELEHASGPKLTPLTEIRKIQRKIAGVQYYTGKQSTDSYQDFDRKCPRSSRIGSLSHSEYVQFEKEFYQDLKDLSSHFERLKLRLLMIVMAGVYPKRWNDSLPMEMVEVEQNKDPQELNRMKIEAFNLRVGEQYRLDPACFTRASDDRLLHKLQSSWHFKSPHAPAVVQRATELLDEVVAARAQLIELSRCDSLFPSEAEEAVQRYREQYRRVVKEIAHLNQVESFYSPTFGSSGKGERGPGQSSDPFRSDYQRVKMPELIDLEARLFSDRKLSYRGSGTGSVLFSSGLNACDAVLSWINKNELSSAHYPGRAKDKPRPIFKAPNTYFEVDQLIDRQACGLGIKVCEVQTSNISALCAKILEEKPRAVFLHPLSTMLPAGVVDVAAVIRGLCTESAKKTMWGKYESAYLIPRITLVIDTTAVGGSIQWDRLIPKSLPSFLQVIFVESLIKYDQVGLDLVQAGLATCLGDDGAMELRNTRIDFGASPPEHSVRMLEWLTSPEQVSARFARHSRNAELMASMLDRASLGPFSFVTDVIYPSLPQHRDYNLAKQVLNGAGAVFSVCINSTQLLAYRELYSFGMLSQDQDDYAKVRWIDQEVGEAYLRLTLGIAKQVGVALNAGTGFGFDVTRIAKYHFLHKLEVRPGQTTDVKLPYLRVAAGTENVKDAILVAQVLIRASEIMDAHLNRGTLERAVREILKKNKYS